MGKKDQEMPSPFGKVIDSPLVIVSNRQPYRHEFSDAPDEQEVVVDRPGGGVVAGLDAVAQQLGGTWIAWGDGEADAVVTDQAGRLEVPPEDPTYTLDRVWLEAADVAGYYEGYANRVLWPLCHTAIGALTYDPSYWEHYRQVNAQFADAVIDAVTPETVVWFQDYHLALAPARVREEHDGVLAHFWHIPWPPLDVFRICPQRRELLEGLLANDVLGFHIDRYGRHFLDCVEALVPEATVNREHSTVRFRGRTTRVASFPLGVDVEAIRETAAAGLDADQRLRRSYDIQGQLVLGVDRLDYSKGIPERLDALEYLWEHQPSLRGEFTHVQKGMPSREGIPEYQELQATIEASIERINQRFGTGDWQPVVSIEEFLPKADLYSLYRAADIMLVTPLRDGMNLVSQEYIASQLERNGVLVLSEFAGSDVYLNDEAVRVNPYDTVELAESIDHALSMDALERNRRMRNLNERIEELDIKNWTASMLEVAEDVRLASGAELGEGPE